MSKGKCGNAEPGIFHPEQGTRYNAAKLYCNGCPVNTECLTFALDNMSDEDGAGFGRWGMWGGTTPDERFSILALAAA